MMNSFLYRGNATLLKRSVALLFVSMFAVVAWAQSFTISHTMTPGTCIADASLKIDVTPTNMPAGTRYQYVLYNLSTGADPVTIPTDQLSQTYTFLTAGTYRVEVISLGVSATPQILNNIRVTTTYVPIEVALNARYTVRPIEHASCPTGVLAFNIKGGRGQYKVKMKTSPLRQGAEIPFTVQNDVYILNDYWSLGDYVIEVSDECNSVVVYQFSINRAQTLDFISNISLGMYDGTTSCKRALVGLTYDPSLIEYERLQDFEFSFSFPFETQPRPWQNFTGTSSSAGSYTYDFDVTFAQLRAHSNAIMRIRHKLCPDKIFERSRLYDLARIGPDIVLQGNNNNYEPTDECNDDVFLRKNNSITEYCWPLNIKVYDTKTGDLISSLNDWDGKQKHVIAKLKNGGQSFRLEITDRKGHNFTLPLSYYERSDWFTYSFPYVDSCNNLTGQYYDRLSEFTIAYKCLQKLTIKREDGVIVHDGPASATGYRVALISSDLNHEFTFVYNDTTIVRNIKFDTQYRGGSNNRITPRGFYHAPNYGVIDFVTHTNHSKGGIAKLTRPDGTTSTQSLAGRYAYNSSPVFQVSGFVPYGRYTYEYFNPCTEKTDVLHIDFDGFYEVQDFSYKVEYLCNSFKITPYAKVYDNVANKYVEPAFILFSKNKALQHEKRVIKLGDSFAAYEPGEYILSVVQDAPLNTYRQLEYSFPNPDTTDSRLFDLNLSLKFPSLTIDNTASFAFRCGSSAYVNIHAKAVGGSGPYTYELYKTSEDRELRRNIVETIVGESAIFEYASMASKYYMLIRDNCGSSYEYDVQVYDVTELKLAYALPERVCEGSPIQLRMLGPASLKQNSQIQWYDPQSNSIGSTADLDIPNATLAKAGRYKVIFRLQGCDIPVTNYVDIQVDRAVSVVSQPKTETGCVGKPLSLVGPTAPEGTVVHWELATTRRPNPRYNPLRPVDSQYLYTWGNELLGTGQGGTYSAIFMKPGMYVVKPVYTIGNCSADGAPITVNVKHCVVPVNPHLMHRPIIDWNKFNSTPTSL